MTVSAARVLDAAPMAAYGLKHKKTIWYLHLYAREAQREESLAVWRAFLAAVAWKS